MKLSSYLSPDLIVTNLGGNNMEELISNFIETVSKRDKNIFKEKKDLVKEIILEREREASTYVGYGIAVPHGRINHFDDLVIGIGILKNPLPVLFQGKEEKLNLIILVAGDLLKSKSILKIMSGISSLALKHKEALDKILKSKNPEEIIEIFREHNIEIDHDIIAEDLINRTLVPARDNNTLEDIARRLISENISGLPVVDGYNNFLGEITERELIAFGMPKYTSILDDLSFLTVGEPFENYLTKENITPIKDLYRTENIVTLDREAPIMEIAYIFMSKKVTRIYVVDKGKYSGIILRSDIIKKILHI
ncbi:MAG: PTS sugar transporter subunit IIA [Cetobacterium sp.]|nr:PTS sugar transporter subunit IIA [Cetobacterium sp.]